MIFIKTKLNVKGMHCKACDMLIKDVLEDLGVKVIESSYKTGNVEINFDENKLSLDQIKHAITEEGYKVVE